MAPRKDRAENSSGDQGASLVLEYLRKQNRPYSAADVSSNLHNKVTKASAAKYLKELHDSKKIQCRAAGKQVVYHILQIPTSENPGEDEVVDLQALDARISNLQAHISDLKNTERSLKAELATYTSTRSFEELRCLYSALEDQKKELTEQITALEQTHNDIKPITVEERDRVENELNKWEMSAKLRGVAVKNLWNVVLDFCYQQESSELSREELWQDVVGCDGQPPC